MSLPDLDRTQAFFLDCDDVLLTSHVNSDGDGIGGCLALQRLLQQMGKKATVVLSDPADPHYDFLADWDRIGQAVSPPERRHAYAIVVDCPHLDRIGAVSEYLPEGARLLNLDHHPGNDGFGHANLVTPQVSSSCELIYHLARAMDLAVDVEVATQLYTGMIFDTGGFRYSLATATTFEVAADLVRLGVRLDMIADRVFGQRSHAEVKQLGQAIHTLTLHFDGLAASMHLTCEQLEPGDPEEVVNYGLLVRGVEVAMLLKEEKPGRFRVSLRARDRVDVSAIAALFGGGGHTKASGCRMEGSLQGVLDDLLAATEESLNRPPN